MRVERTAALMPDYRIDTRLLGCDEAVVRFLEDIFHARRQIHCGQHFRIAPAAIHQRLTPLRCCRELGIQLPRPILAPDRQRRNKHRAANRQKAEHSDGTESR